MQKYIGFLVLSLTTVFFISGCGINVDRLEVSKLFSDGMVIQREAPIRVWGWGTTGATVTVLFNGASADAIVGEDGKWKVELAEQKAGGPYELSITSGSKSITISDVLVGEVWLASGQSNMQWEVVDANNAEQEIVSSANDKIRQFHVYRFSCNEPLDTLVNSKADSQPYANKWEKASPETTGHFSAVAYFFARELEKVLNVPVGVIHASWGGTVIESWMSDEALQSKDTFTDAYSNWEERRMKNKWRRKEYQYYMANLDSLISAAAEHGEPLRAYRNKPAVIYNGMLKPVIPYPIKGVLWYQGEANAHYPEEYDDLMIAMIDNWRSEWALGNFPFLYVQLAGYKTGEDLNWADIRYAQTKVLEYPNTGMAVALDIGDAEVHPMNKQDVGHRLALNALKLAYGKDVINSGPMFDSLSHDGNKIIVTFKFAGDGLAVPEGETLGGFEVYDKSEEEWVAAEAEISSENQITVWNDKVKKPAAARYGWKSWAPDANLYNTYNGDIWLPAVPFMED